MMKTVSTSCLNPWDKPVATREQYNQHLCVAQVTTHRPKFVWTLTCDDRPRCLGGMAARRHVYCFWHKQHARLLRRHPRLHHAGVGRYHGRRLCHSSRHACACSHDGDGDDNLHSITPDEDHYGSRGGTQAAAGRRGHTQLTHACTHACMRLPPPQIQVPVRPTAPDPTPKPHQCMQQRAEVPAGRRTYARCLLGCHAPCLAAYARVLPKRAALRQCPPARAPKAKRPCAAAMLQARRLYRWQRA